jgi:fatty acid desaturase
LDHDRRPEAGEQPRDTTPFIGLIAGFGNIKSSQLELAMKFDPDQGFFNRILAVILMTRFTMAVLVGLFAATALLSGIENAMYGNQTFYFIIIVIWVMLSIWFLWTKVSAVRNAYPAFPTQQANSGFQRRKTILLVISI